tara:strand:+ start:510 stop:1775 length:1266 start_codon:yes stop_codon:yes gene_type:complete
MLEKLLLFLGIKSWNIENCLVKKTNVNAKFLRSNKNIKSINLLNLLEEDQTPSPKMALYKINRHSNPDVITNCFCVLYTIYFLFITCILLIQPVYTLYMFSKDTNKLKYLTSFFLHINLPLIHIWAKIYFKTNHFDNILKCKALKGSLIISASVISMIINLVDIKSFYNEYHWLNTFNDNVLFFTLIVIEWIYSRITLFLFVFTFMFVLKEHIKKLKCLKCQLEDNEFDFENNVCLSNLIIKIAKTKFDIGKTINLFNDIISYTTVLGGIALAIFIRDIFPHGFKDLNLNFDDHDRYLIHPIILYICIQIILIIIMRKYSYAREEILHFIKSIDFISRFLMRTSTQKIAKKSNGNLSLVTLNILEDSAFTLDWLILGNMLSEKWLDFNIFGISTSDGKLIKQSIAIGGTLLFSVNFLQNNN